jgi:hypothetical protein
VAAIRHPRCHPKPGIESDDAWQERIAAYLTRRCDMGPIALFEVLRDCDFDEVMRARYLRLARETMS